MKKQKIAIISSGYFPIPPVKGGAVETLIQLIIDENEKYNGVEIDVYCMHDIIAVEKTKRIKNTTYKFISTSNYIDVIDKIIYFFASKVLKIKKTMSFRFILKRINYIYKVAKELRKSQYDKVIIENTATLFWTLKLFNNYKKYEGKYIYHLHNEVGFDFFCRKQILKNCKILGVSEFINDKFREKFNEFGNEYSVLKNCIDLKKFRVRENKINIRKIYDIKYDEKIVIFAGRLCEEKGVKELLYAFSKIKYEKAKLIIVGNYYFGTDMVSDFEEEIFSIARKIENKVIFTGYIPNDDISEYYNQADFAVLPSVWDEPAGLTIIEAITCQLPVITTNSGGIPEYVNNKCTIIIDRKDLIDNLVEAIELLLTNEEKVRAMKEECLKLSKEYAANKYYENFVYELNMQ